MKGTIIGFKSVWEIEKTVKEEIDGIYAEIQLIDYPVYPYKKNVYSNVKNELQNYLCSGRTSISNWKDYPDELERLKKGIVLANIVAELEEFNIFNYGILNIQDILNIASGLVRKVKIIDIITSSALERKSDLYTIEPDYGVMPRSYYAIVECDGKQMAINIYRHIYTLRRVARYNNIQEGTIISKLINLIVSRPDLFLNIYYDSHWRLELSEDTIKKIFEISI